MNRFAPFRASIMAVLFTLPTLAAAGDWEILSVNGADVIGEPRISLERDGAISGMTGCNSFQGTGRFENSVLMISEPLAVTRMACPGEALATQESTILQLLLGETAFTHDPFTGAFALSRGENQLELVEAVPSVFDTEFVNVYGLSGPLNIRQAPGIDAPIVTRVLPGTLLRNAGCTSGDTHDWCNIEFLDASGTAGWAAADYLQSAPATVRAEQGLFDGIGRLSCQFGTETEPLQCDYGIARDAAHSAVLVIYKPDGDERVLHFADGVFAFAEIENAQEAGASETSSSNGQILATISGEHYEIPQNVVRGSAE